MEGKWAGFPEKMQETVLIALQDLRSSLKDKGANLMIRLGNAENVIQELVKEVVTSIALLVVYEEKQPPATVMPLWRNSKIITQKCIKMRDWIGIPPYQYPSCG